MQPKMFAAAVPICGGGDESKARMIAQVPVWAFHGEKDEAVRVERSRDMIAAIRKAGGRPKYTEYKGEGHVIWSKVVNEVELLPWIFTQKRASK
jgi:predicted peptidase